MFKSILLLGLTFVTFAHADVKRARFQAGSNGLALEFLSDKVIHFELSAVSLSPGDIYKTPYVDADGFNFSGPAIFSRNGNSFETSALKIDVDPSSLSISVFDKIKGVSLTRISPVNLNQAWKGLDISKGSMTDAYGLGELFLPSRIGNANGNWVGEVRYPGNGDGNAMTGFHGGATGNAQFPVLYALGPQKTNYALFLDQVYKQNWNLQGDPWRVEMWGDQIRGFVIGGADFPELRQTYMSLTGRPPVPPKKAFGLWVSEYGFDNWDEIRDRLRTLRANKFPIDGFVMDLQWFGGVAQNEFSPMGTLRFDERNFPNPAATVKNFREVEGIGLITIEESYVARGLPEHKSLESQGLLARANASGNKAFFIDENNWWGLGGMLDWSNPATSTYWHNTKRQPLIDLGIMGHWTDLGEPEMYHTKSDPNALPFYHGFPELGKNRQADIHNVFSLLWSKGIAAGYKANNVQQRPWILSRSGGPGIQRYGAGMWSGDIGSNFGSLASHFNAQMHMSLSGIDYFGSDVGGFHRGGMAKEPGIDLNELYTQWFANSSAFDVPVRPHTENVDNSKNTAPDRVGNMASNLANIRLRYELSPYYYSLAHRAYLYGEPVVPPVVYYYQDAPSDRADFVVRTMGHEKLVGRDLLFAVVAGAGESKRDIYLPPGEWVDYYSQQRHPSAGQSLRAYPEYVSGIFRLPLFVRAGAIIPKMFVDDKTQNIEGKRSDGTLRNELIARVYSGADQVNYEFTVFEDDGVTNAYQSGKVAQTVIRQQRDGGRVSVSVMPVKGSYAGMVPQRNTVVELVPQADISRQVSVQVNGVSLRQYLSKIEFESATRGWYTAGGVVFAKAGEMPVGQIKQFLFTGTPPP